MHHVAADPSEVLSVHGLSVHEDARRRGAWPNLACENFQQRGLASAAWARDGHDLARARVERDVLEDVVGAWLGGEGGTHGVGHGGGAIGAHFLLDYNLVGEVVELERVCLVSRGRGRGRDGGYLRRFDEGLVAAAAGARLEARAGAAAAADHLVAARSAVSTSLEVRHGGSNRGSID